MQRARFPKRSMLLLLGVGLPYTAFGQARAIGSVSASDVIVTNTAGKVLEMNAGRVVLLSGGTARAKDRTAEVALTRGGSLRICQGTAVHLTQGASAGLLLAVDRGSMEVRMKALAGDVILTPDLRFTIGPSMHTDAAMELSLRVVSNGDTCVDNHGRKAPTLNITDAFGAVSYQLKPGQHVLFEHGSLREVVDRETTPCGCPPDAPGANGHLTAAEAAHPFPAAVSDGLTAPATLPEQAPGVTHTQVVTTLAYDPNASVASATVQGSPGASKPVVKARSRNPFRALGRLFKRLFVR